MRRRRRGLVLILVLIVVAMLSLAGFRFSELMVLEQQTVRLGTEQAQTRLAVDSGVELLLALADQPATTQAIFGGMENNPGRFQGVPLTGELGVEDGSGPRFSVLTPEMEAEGTGESWRYGTSLETARLNLGAVLAWDAATPGTGRQSLLALPGMTPEIADSLLDWLDADNEPREMGAEREYYESHGLERGPANRVPASVTELLWARGMRRELLEGRDWNRNGRLDEFEQRQREGTRETAGATESGGWQHLVTLHSAERNETRMGQRRVDVNQDDLRRLHREVSRALDGRAATFVVAYRQFGPAAASGKAGPASGVVDWNVKPRFTIQSLWDLVGVNVSAKFRGSSEARLVASPWTPGSGEFYERLEELLDQLSVTSAARLTGRVNVNRAPLAVLAAVPGMTKSLAEAIVERRGGEAGDGLRGGAKDEQEQITWLLRGGVLKLESFREVGPYLTTQSDTYRAQIIARSSAQSPASRVEVVIDATSRPARVVFWENLDPLGPAYPRTIWERGTPGVGLAP